MIEPLTISTLLVGLAGFVLAFATLAVASAYLLAHPPVPVDAVRPMRRSGVIFRPVRHEP